MLAFYCCGLLFSVDGLRLLAVACCCVQFAFRTLAVGCPVLFICRGVVLVTGVCCCCLLCVGVVCCCVCR